MLFFLFLSLLFQLLTTEEVELSLDTSATLNYVGYLWANSKFVFITPGLRATAMKGKSVSKKICGFDLTSNKVQSIPYMVYLVDETSGRGEIQVKPHIEIDYQKETIMHLLVDAYDCDSFPHYSKRANILIHVFNSFGPKFDKNSYSFSVKKSLKIGDIIGKINVIGMENVNVNFSLYHVDNIPFGIDEFGTIKTLSSLESVDNSLINFRVVATEKSKKIAKQSIASITVEIVQTCKNKLYGIPDQLDYKIKSQVNNIINAERLIQDQSQLRLEFCDLSSPFKEIKVVISLIQSEKKQNSLDNVKVCQRDITANKIQRMICEVNPGTIDFFKDKEGIINLKDGIKVVDPELIPYMNNEFTLTWWMKRHSKLETTIFCFQNNEFKEIISVNILNCKIKILISDKVEFFNIPVNNCQLNKWLYYTISQESYPNSAITITVGGKKIFQEVKKTNFEYKNVSRFFVGQCSSITNNLQKKLLKNNTFEIGVISLTKDKFLTHETISCMSTCGETILVSDSIKKWSNLSIKREENYLYFTSRNIHDVIKMISKIDYVNSYCSTSRSLCSEIMRTQISIDLSIECKSGETINLPINKIKVNIILPKKPSNDSIEVDLYVSSTILTKDTRSIRLFPDIRFINSITEEPISQKIKLESCSIRPLQRNFINNEKLYLSHLMTPLVKEFNLRINSDLGFWILEGEGTAELYESFLKHVLFDMHIERRKFFVICTLKGGELTSQAFVDVILIKKDNIIVIKEENPMDFDHNSKKEQKGIVEYEKYFKERFDITKPNFIAVIIMAVIGGAIWAVLTIVISYVLIRRRRNKMSRNRMKINGIKSYQRQLNSTFDTTSQLVSNLKNVCSENEEDRISMADVPDVDECCLENTSCDACKDHEIIFNDLNFNKDIPRSKTVNFPIIHKRF